jgi:hypothetical protein
MQKTVAVRESEGLSPQLRLPGLEPVKVLQVYIFLVGKQFAVWVFTEEAVFYFFEHDAIFTVDSFLIAGGAMRSCFSPPASNDG